MARQPENLILASASPRRVELLQRMGLRFEVCPAAVEEANEAPDGPVAMVLSNARLKAAAVGRLRPDSLVLGSDTTVALGVQVLNKPVDMDDARRMLRQLAGRQHTVHTAVTLIWEAGGFDQSFVEHSQVHFKAFDDAVIEGYFEQVNPLDKAGAYGIQQARESIIARYEGSLENIMGLPVQALFRKLSEHGFDFRV